MLVKEAPEPRHLAMRSLIEMTMDQAGNKVLSEPELAFYFLGLQKQISSVKFEIKIQFSYEFFFNCQPFCVNLNV